MDSKDQVEYTGNGTAGREADVQPTGFFFQMPQREWQGLTDEEIGDIIEASQITLKNYCSEDKQTEYARAIEAKLKERNA